MFTYSKLGKMGRFGNQLFQIASTMGIALRNEQECVFPRWEHTMHFKRPIPQTYSALYTQFIIKQGPGRFQFLDFKVTLDPAYLIDLEGFFQSEKYFTHCAEMVRDYFEPSTSVMSEIEKNYGERLRDGPTCILVVRRGDYLLYPLSHPVMPAQYYREAMDAFDGDTMFFVTSDDIEWCRANIRAKRLIYLPQEKWIHNFFVGTLCQDAIISNTTFGWWIAWLNKNHNKRVIAPKQWFGRALGHLDTCDLLPNGWTVK